MRKAQEIYHARKDYFLSTLKRLGPLIGQKVATPDGEGILISVTPKDTEGFPFVSPVVVCQVWFTITRSGECLDNDVEGYHADDVKAITAQGYGQLAGTAMRLSEQRIYSPVPKMTKDNNSEFVSAIADYLRRENLQSIHITNAAVSNVDIDVEALQRESKMLNGDMDTLLLGLERMTKTHREQFRSVKSRLQTDAQNAPFRTR